MGKKEKKLFYIEYTVLFAMVAGLAVYYFYSQGKTLIDADGDGFRQHFRALVYYSNILKEMFSSFFSGHFIIPQWDYVIGEGADIMHTFHYYAVGDIFTFFSFLCPEEYMYLYYDGATIVRMYCAGLAFSALCFYKKKNNRYIVLACSLLYAFCAFNLISMNGHVFFISASVWLPLIIMGVEMAINDDRAYWLSLAVMFSALGSIYFFYINVVSTVLFVLIRLLFLEKSWKEKGIALIRIGMYSALGTLMGCVVFLPMLKTMIGSARMDVSVDVPFLYSLSDYIGLPIKFTFNDGSYLGGFSMLWLPAYVYVLCRNKNKTLIALIITSLLFIGLPKLSAVYNAFTYPTDRWCYSVSLLVAYVIADSFDDIKDIGSFLIINVIAGICYYAYCIYFDSAIWQIHALMLVISICIFVFIRFIKNSKLCDLACLATVFVFLLLEIAFSFDPNYWDLTKKGADITDIQDKLKGEFVVFESIDDDSFFRYSGNELVENATVQGEYSSTQYYWSIVNDYVVDYRTQLGNSDRSLHHIDNYGDRFAQNALAGIKYYINQPEQYVPYGFEYLDTLDGYEVWRSDYSLPLVFAYDNYILPEQWQRFDPAEKNEVLLQAGYIDHPVEEIEPYSVRMENTDVSYQMSLGDDIEVGEHEISVKGEDAYIYLDAECDKSGEYYVMVQGIYSSKMSAYIRCTYQDVEKYFIFKGSDNQHYTNRHDYIVDLGYFEGINGTITIDFSDGGDYTYDSIKIIYQPLEYQIECINRLKNIKIEELDVDKNTVNAKVEVDDNKLVCFSIPYSKGWKAYVDGEKAELLNCDIQYMAVMLPEGSHLIELKYSTPLLNIGVLLTALSSTACVFLVVRDHKRKKVSE